jgi:uncharacterized protein YndB with AHSA1/START domain
MSPEGSRVLVAVRVPCEPAEAFTRFTTEIGQWWRPNPLFQFREGRNGVLAFEAGEGGRLIETYEDGTSFVIGVVSTWAPPRLLVLSWRQANFPPAISTELHVTFEPTEPGQTRVTVEHYGWDTIPSDHEARHGFPLPTFQLRFAEWWRSILESWGPHGGSDSQDPSAGRL